MRILLLSAYGAGSHRQWRDVVSTMLPDCTFEVLELPARHFSWRVRGNALYWSMAERAVLEREYDLLLATSMVDLATLRGLVRSIANLPTIVYFHENQFAYPEQSGQQGIVEAQVTSIYSALAADQLLFNSAYNRDSFLAGVARLLDKLPDFVPAGVPDHLSAKSDVLPVPLEPVPAIPEQARGSVLRVQWLGRFEYDKGPELLSATLEALESTGLDYEIAITGQQFRRGPEAFDDLRNEYIARIVQFGYIESRQDYLAQLAQAHIVLSTARQEFQGLAVMEAVQRGAVPVVPNRLAYVETYPAACRYSVEGDDLAQASAAAERIVDTWEALHANSATLPDLAAYEVPALEPRYRALFEAVRGRQANS